MKTKHNIVLVVALIGIITLSVVGQENPPPVDNTVYVTNNVTVIMTEENNNALTVAWRLANNARTNGLPPFSAPVPALTYREFRDEIGRGAFEAIALQAKQQNEAYFLQQYRNATPEVRARIARVLANKE